MNLAIVALAILITSTYAQAPQQVLQMNDLSNAGQLYLDYCAFGQSICITVKAICYGQCVDQSTADEMGYGCSGDVEGVIPYGFHYARWHGLIFGTKKKFSGKANKDYPRENCHNTR